MTLHPSFKPVLILLLLALLHACATRDERLIAVDLEEEQPEAPELVEAALAEAERLSPEEYGPRLLAWAQDYLGDSRIKDAGTLLQALEPEKLDSNGRLQWVLLSAQYHLARQEPGEALAKLTSETLDIEALMAEAPARLRNRLQLLRADALMLDGELRASLRERVAMHPMLEEDDDRDYNRRMTWLLLMHLPMNELNSLANKSESDMLGWVELARLFRDPLIDIDTQARQLKDWQREWQDHPAARNTPDMVSALARAADERPSRVAVMLPLSGSLAGAGEAIRNGLLTGYYSALSRNHPVPVLRFYDTGSADVIELYNRAIEDDAQFVLGPLDKAGVDKLAGVDRLPVPTLALNYVDRENVPANLYQFGLAPEDEARQVARHTFDQGARLAGVLFPDSDWGQRVADTFVETFEQKGGLITTRQAYNDAETRAVADLLSIGQSHGRARELNRLTSLHLQFEPRRRQDLDILFLVANTDQARQVKPALNFHYASDLPVYATSHVYGGRPRPDRDHDLNGIRFVDLPWLLDRESNLHDLARETWPDGHGSRERLFALGVDAWRLQARLHMLQTVPDSQLPGVTGRLKVGHNRHLVRQLDWAFFSQGEPRRLPVVSGTGNRNARSENDAAELITRPARQQE